MSQDYIRLCPSCGTENEASVLRCVCGALLTGVDLSVKGAAPAVPEPAREPAWEPVAAAQEGPICPFEDCGQPNPPGATTCLYCNRPLENEPQAEAPTTLVNLPSALRERYRIVRPLPTSGAEAELLVVEPVAGGEACVAKIYRHGIHPKAEVQERLKRIDPAHKVRLLDSGLSDGFTWELMEYCPEGSLRGMLKDGPLAAPLVRQLAAELGAAVAAVHEVKLIHRDLKPENVLIRHRAPLDLVLTDFGISSLQDATVLFTGVARTLSYGAPETIAGVLDSKADYWSLGLILLEACLGRHPFAELSDAVILHRLTTRSMDLGAVRDPGLRALLRGLLLRDPKRRWGRAEVARWLAGDLTLSEPTEEAADLGSRKPYRIGDEDCFTADQLAVALAKNWKLGASDLNNGLLSKWFREQLHDQNLVRFLIDLNDEPGVPADVRLLRLIVHLAPGLPPVWRGESIALGAVLARAGLALKGSREAADWLVDVQSCRVLETYAAAGDPELADMVDRWGRGLADFNATWDATAENIRIPPPGGVVYFDDVAFGRGGTSLKRPPAGLLAARLLALAYDKGWERRLRELLVTEFARLQADCPWLEKIGNPKDCAPPRLLVLHAALQEARHHAARAREVKAAADEERAGRLLARRQEAVLLLESVRQLASGFWYGDDTCHELGEKLEAYFSLLADVRSDASVEEVAQALRTRLMRAEPYATRLRRLLDELVERRMVNRGWFNRNSAQFAGAGAFLLMVFVPTWLLPFMGALGLVAAWRLLPNLLTIRQMQRLGKLIQA